MLENLTMALPQVFSLSVFLYLSAGVIIGLILGAIPGLGGTMGVGVLLPLTFTMPALESLVLLVGIYKGTMMGGSFSAILINTPGDAPAAATVFDGYPLSEKGQSRKALQAAIYGSGFGGLISSIVLMFGAVTLAPLVLNFGPSEIFWIAIFSLIITSTLGGISVWKGFLSSAMGLLLGCVGLDSLSNTPRFGIVADLGMINGIDLIAFLMGAFALSEIYINAMPKAREKAAELRKNVGTFHGPSLTRKEVKDSIPAFLSGSTIGCFIGAAPGLGGTAAALLSYGWNKTIYDGKRKKGEVKFGEGAVPGVVAVESANSAVSATVLLPLLTLGIPGSATAALILAALMMQGIQVGPQIFNTHGPLLYAFFIALCFGDFLNMLYGNLLTKPITWLLKKNQSLVYPIILLLCITGVYSVNQRVLDLGVMVFIGLLSYGMKRTKIPVAPMVVSFVLSSLIEENFRLSLMISNGNFNIFWGSAINKVLLIACAVFAAIIAYQKIKNKGIEDESEADEVEEL